MTTTADAPFIQTAEPHGPAIYFDGTSSARHDVVIHGTASGLNIVAADGRAVDTWAYADLRRQSAPDGVLRLGRFGETLLARLEIRDAALAGAIEDRAVTLDRSGAAARAMRRKVVGLSFAAVVSLIATGVIGVPALISRMMPFVPVSVEKKLGIAVDRQIRASLDTKELGEDFGCTEAAGRQALLRLVAKLESAAALPVTLSVDVVRKSEPNAFALPGGHVYVYQGLIDAAQKPDEVAGVLAHEIGHVAHRDGTRTVLQAAGLSFLFGMMLGDFVGGGAVVIAAKTVLRSSYSRQVEASADNYSVSLMTKIGGDPRALAVILDRIASDKEAGPKILRDHPETKDRVVAINAAAATPAAQTPLLSADDWAALKHICTAAHPKPATASAGVQVATANGKTNGPERGTDRGAPDAERGQKMKAQSDGAPAHH
jgi:Zn-dependent protease with chaperone function